MLFGNWHVPSVPRDPVTQISASIWDFQGQEMDKPLFLRDLVGLARGKQGNRSAGAKKDSRLYLLASSSGSSESPSRDRSLCGDRIGDGWWVCELTQGMGLDLLEGYGVLRDADEDDFSEQALAFTIWPQDLFTS